MPAVETNLTSLLEDWNAGDPEALPRIMELFYDDFRRMARHRIGKEPPGHTLQPTALVHETFLRFVERRRVRWLNRDQFFAFTARLMNWVLVTHARKKTALKRGGEEKDLPLEDELPNLVEIVDEEVARLEDALADLQGFDPEGHKAVVLRFIHGLKHAEIAGELGVSTSTARNRWKDAKAWLYRQLAEDERTRRGPDAPEREETGRWR